MSKNGSSGDNLSLRSKLHQPASLSNPPAGASRKKYDSHDFVGYGTYDLHHTPHNSEIGRITQRFVDQEQHEQLNELEATAISGNDILSSTFYVSGLVTLVAGTMAPLCLVLVGGLLYLFRGIYHEAVMALPCNGGTYNILLNCTSKQFASMAAVFAIIAYITTGVVSALEAVAYLNTVVEPYYGDVINVQWATIGLLAFFCVLTNLGMKESATFAKIVFVLHVGTLTLLSVLGTLHVIFHPAKLLHNWSNTTPSYPSVNMMGRMVEGSVWTALFYGLSSAMLGCSGFETSSQFVEEQAPGVFPKTLRNMWLGIMIFNPLLSLISFSALDLADILEHHDTVLAHTAGVVGQWVQESIFRIPVDDNAAGGGIDFGFILSTLVSVDAFIVLAAALLTGYVGINGLVRRMSMDRCMPQLLLIANPWTGTDSIILVGFFVLCASQVVALHGDVKALGGVYCLSFLTVMTIVALGNIMLKIKRPSLPREVTTSWAQAIAGLVGSTITLFFNIVGKPEMLTYFFIYFILVGLLVLAMFQRVRLMRILFKMFKPSKRVKGGGPQQKSPEIDKDDAEFAPLIPQGLPEPSVLISKRELEEIFGTTAFNSAPPANRNCLKALSQAVREVQSVPFVFFCKHDDLHMLNKAMLYIQKNEQTNTIFVVHCSQTSDDEDQEESSDITDRQSLAEHVKLVDLLYPKVKISLLVVRAAFNHVTVEWLSQATNVPVNAMFISCPDENFTMKVSQLRGMRIIFSYD